MWRIFKIGNLIFKNGNLIFKIGNVLYPLVFFLFGLHYSIDKTFLKIFQAFLVCKLVSGLNG